MRGAGGSSRARAAGASMKGGPPMHRSLLLAALTVAAVCLGASGAGASLLIGISNGASPWPVAATTGSLTFGPTGAAPFTCSATLRGTLPTATYVAPLGTDVLPIGRFDVANVTGCTSGTAAVPLFPAPTADWQWALHRVLLN